ncbi:cytoplasmic protein [Kosakonia sp. SMBL-WEM22]|uniref:cytoplasmic protein n=1 Tax=Kosakonia sp. SMBL-WEM22 TaxID=2725560 RepID=UPI001CB97B8D|nr:cytoplasmic protein [Kosakonia sp. SMBL-WEM22]MDV5353752.1 cytoplasmic protein [Enterobacter asburiae]
MAEIENNNVYINYSESKSDEFILKQNIDALVQSKNETIQRIAQDLVSIPAALVRLKWQNRREIYPLQVKEEIYGATIAAIIEQHPELREKIMGRLEANYQHLVSRESATLRWSRRLSEGEYRTSTVSTVSAAAKEAPAKASSKGK